VASYRVACSVPRAPPGSRTRIAGLGGQRVIHYTNGAWLLEGGLGCQRRTWWCRTRTEVTSSTLFVKYTAMESNHHLPLRRRQCYPLHQRRLCASPGYRPLFHGLKDRCITLMLARPATVFAQPPVYCPSFLLRFLVGRPGIDPGTRDL
jgi:hypothetical protein